MCSHRAHYWHGPPTVSATVILSTLCIRAVSVNGLDRASESKVVAIQMPGYGFEALGRSSPPSFLFPWIGPCVQMALVTARWEEGFRCPGIFTNSESIHQGMTSRVLFRSCSDPCVDNLGDYRWHRLLRCVQSLEIVHRGINSRLMLISLILELVFDALLAKIELVPLNDHHAYARDHNDRF